SLTSDLVSLISGLCSLISSFSLTGLTTCFTRFATDTWGQLSGAKFRKTVWEYWSSVPWWPLASVKSLIQKVASIWTVRAFGAFASPSRKAILEVPPPELGGFCLATDVEIWITVVEVIVFPTSAAARTEFGLSTIACVMPTMSPGGLRNALGVARFCEAKWTLLAGLPIVNGVMSTGANAGGP